jgi:hypothetical protein
MTRREIAIAVGTFLGVLLLVAMLFVTILGVLGEGLMGGLMRDTSGVMFFVMVSFPLLAFGALAVLGWWIARREGG